MAFDPDILYDEIPVSDKVYSINDDVRIPPTLYDGPPVPPKPSLDPDLSIADQQILAWLAQVDSESHNDSISITDLTSYHIFLQADGGANRSIINLRYIFPVYWDIDPRHIDGMSNSITCTGKGIFPLVCSDGSTILIEIFYSKDATSTVISPTDIVFSTPDFDS